MEGESLLFVCFYGTLLASGLHVRCATCYVLSNFDSAVSYISHGRARFLNRGGRYIVTANVLKVFFGRSLQSCTMSRSALRKKRNQVQTIECCEHRVHTTSQPHAVRCAR